MPDSDDKITETDLTNLVRSVGKPAPESVKESVLEKIRSQPSRIDSLREQLNKRKKDDLEREGQ